MRERAARGRVSLKAGESRTYLGTIPSSKDAAGVPSSLKC